MEPTITISISRQQAENLMEDLNMISDSSEHGHGNVMKQLQDQLTMGGLADKLRKN